MQSALQIVTAGLGNNIWHEGFHKKPFPPRVEVLARLLVFSDFYLSNLS